MIGSKFLKLIILILSFFIPPLAFSFRGRVGWAWFYCINFLLLLWLNREGIDWLDRYGWLRDFGFVVVVMVVAFIHAALMIRCTARPLTKRIKNSQLVIFLPVLVTLSAPWFLKHYHSEIVELQSLSMAPSLLRGDLVVVDKFSRFGLSKDSLSGGDRVLFFSPADARYYIKRVVALPGDRLTYADKRLTVNGVLVSQALWKPGRRSDTYLESIGEKTYPILLRHDKRSQTVAVTLADQRYYLMGDSRDNSTDSRSFGAVAGVLLLGRLRE